MLRQRLLFPAPIFMMAILLLGGFFSTALADQTEDLQKMAKKIHKEIEKGKGVALVKMSFYMDEQKGLRKFFGPSQALGLLVRPQENLKKEKAFRPLNKFYAALIEDPGVYTVDSLFLMTGYAPKMKYRGTQTVQEKVMETRQVPIQKTVQIKPDTVVYMGEISVEEVRPGDYRLRYTFSPSELQTVKRALADAKAIVLAQRLFPGNKMFEFGTRR